MKSSLRTRLILSFVLVIIITMGSFALIGRVSINQWFTNMILASGNQYAERMAFVFGVYYVQNGSWEGVENLVISFRDFQEGNPFLRRSQSGDNSSGNLPSWPMLPEGKNFLSRPDERLLLVDNENNILFDSDAQAGSAQTLLSYPDTGAEILVDGQKVGRVIVASSLGILNSFQQTYLHNVNRLVLVGGGVAIVLAILLGAWQAVRIVRPVKALSQASLKLAGGDYSQRIPVTGDDELGEMTNAFNQMAGELERQEMLRRRTLADVAHELRTPLSVLQIDLESIEDGLVEPDAEAIERLLHEVATIRGLVEDLRILSLADAGELSLEFQLLDLNAVIEINARRIERPAIEKGIEIIRELEQGELWVQADEQRISQVMLNLLSNAIQFTLPGGKICIRSARVGDVVQVTVRDNGEGIAQEDLPHIFERLYRSDRARTRQNGGSGLGLSIARSLVLSHNGRIWAESTPGQGSAFTFELPIASAG